MPLQCQVVRPHLRDAARFVLASALAALLTLGTGPFRAASAGHVSTIAPATHQMTVTDHGRTVMTFTAGFAKPGLRTPSGAFHVLGRDVVITVTAPDCAVARCVALTFDDGPTQYTPSILRLLEERHAVATFFVIGRHALQLPAVVRREQHDGDAIGDHTVTHPHLTALSSARIRFELDGAAHDIASVTGHRPTLLRPPFGNYNPHVTALARQTGLAVVMWSLDPRDWRRITPQVIEQRVINHVRPGDIIVLHDRYARTPRSLPRILTALASRGYIFVTVPQLFAGSRGTQPGMVYHHG